MTSRPKTRGVTLNDLLREYARQQRGPHGSVGRMVLQGNPLKNAQLFYTILVHGFDVLEALSTPAWGAEVSFHASLPGLGKDQAKAWAKYLNRIFVAVYGDNKSRAEVHTAKDGDVLALYIKNADKAYICLNYLSIQLSHLVRVIVGTWQTAKTDEGYVWIRMGLKPLISGYGIPLRLVGDYVYVNVANTEEELRKAGSLFDDAAQAFNGLKKINVASHLPHYQSVKTLPLYNEAQKR